METVKVFKRNGWLCIKREDGDTIGWYANDANEGGHYHFYTTWTTEQMMHALIDKREDGSIEKMLEEFEEVEVEAEMPVTQILNKAQAVSYETVCHECGRKLREGDKYAYGVDFWTCAKCLKPMVTLTGIPADPFPPEAVECWEVTREGESEVKRVWKIEGSPPWCNSTGGGWYFPDWR